MDKLQMNSRLNFERQALLRTAANSEKQVQKIV